MRTYEFDENEAEIVWIFGNKISIASLLMMAGGVIGVTVGFIDAIKSETPLRGIVLLIEFLFLIVIGFILSRPSDNFKRIATSEGRDIPELIQGIKEFNFAFLIAAGLVGIIAILNFILILVKVGD